jgi:hypothetical protein
MAGALVNFRYDRQPKPRPVPERYFDGTRNIHLCWDKEGLIREIKKRGPNRMLTTSEPLTKEKAIAWVRGFPTSESIPFPECDDFDHTGRCNGHPTEQSDPSARPAHLLPPDPDFPASIRVFGRASTLPSAAADDAEGKT